MSILQFLQYTMFDCVGYGQWISTRFCGSVMSFINICVCFH